jgi:hypothetical protein
VLERVKRGREWVSRQSTACRDEECASSECCEANKRSGANARVTKVRQAFTTLLVPPSFSWCCVMVIAT